jgi:hypothetical protein
VDELGRIRGLLEVYEAALAEIRNFRDPALDELEARLEARAAAAAHDYFQLLRDVGAITAEPSWPARRPPGGSTSLQGRDLSFRTWPR